MNLPSYVKHIKRPEVGDQKTWCGGAMSVGEFYFTGLDHVAANALKEGRLLACPECVTEATIALEKGAYETNDRD